MAGLRAWERALCSVVTVMRRDRPKVRQQRRRQASVKQERVLAAVRLGCASHPAIVRHTGLEPWDVSNTVRLLREKGKLAMGLPIREARVLLQETW